MVANIFHGYMVTYTIIAMITLSCAKYSKNEQTNQVKAIVSHDDDLHDGLGGARIFEDEWKIGFYVQETCDWTKDEQISEIKREIISATEKWLDLFREKAKDYGKEKDVVKSITAEQVDATVVEGSTGLNIATRERQDLPGGALPQEGLAPAEQAKSRRKVAIGDVNGEYVFVVFFYCTVADIQPENGGAFALMSLRDLKAFADTDSGVPQIHIYLPVCEDNTPPPTPTPTLSSSSESGSEDGSEEGPCSDMPEFYEYCRKKPIFRMKSVPISKHVLLHEIGHAMGLLDTYDTSTFSHIPESGDVFFGKKFFDTDDPTHVGEPAAHRHPSSVMSCDYKGMDADGNPVLADDDTAGIKVLYDRFSKLGFYDQ